MYELPEGVVDAWINPNIFPPEPGKDVGYLFGKEYADRLTNGTSLDELVEQMDAAGIARGILCSGLMGTDGGGDGGLAWNTAARDKYPDRFALSHVVDPRRGMKAVRLVEDLARDGHVLVRMVGLQSFLYYNDAALYPVYAKCIELGLPVGLNVGFPGPQVPSKFQDPLPIDDVAAFFPELRIVLQHGGEPWVDTCVKLMVKWPNISYMTSAIAPKHIPPQVIQYANTRGADRVMWASDFPLLTHERCMREVRALPFRSQEHVDKFLARNAEAFFFKG